MSAIDDKEIDQLEDIRRYGYPEHRTGTENEYYTLPPKRSNLIEEWVAWRRDTNARLVLTISKSTGEGKEIERELTACADEKTPPFFKGHFYIKGQRVKDEYGGSVIMETDTELTRIEKKIMNENFFMFGIPRVSTKRIQPS